ncbi:esterase [Xaviernesmea oryzae]|uniref:Esterase n=1 Tax=Xaviernesmea oryzae TaxID=464029 RepID=A0A1Q9AUQ6_9HYPH|nr:alpha/beta hydrolase [Xaviernesmea oryzae]OLP59197.1 esterase [Xaviernesmea oryzae]SEK82134.1 phospholipase/carboxylesterase [Xaviernesmea oryzae]
MSDDSYHHLVRPGAPGAPAFFVFHGTGGDENQFFAFASRLLPDATIVSPRGDISEHGAARFFRRTGEGVYDMADLARATAKMAGFMRRMADEHATGESLGLGFSNGANILANVLIEQPGLFSKAALMHPLIPFAPTARAPLTGAKVLITAGRRDPICPVPLTEALAAHLEGRGAMVETEWHAGGHDIRPNEITALERFLTGDANI